MANRRLKAEQKNMYIHSGIILIIALVIYLLGGGYAVPIIMSAIGALGSYGAKDKNRAILWTHIVLLSLYVIFMAIMFFISFYEARWNISEIDNVWVTMSLAIFILCCFLLFFVMGIVFSRKLIDSIDEKKGFLIVR